MASKYYLAAYDYEATTATNLSLRAGETVLVHEIGEQGWWNGQTGSGAGWFPESYVVPNDDPLALGWVPLTDDHGRTYYLNSVSNETSWDRPTLQADAAQADNDVPPPPPPPADEPAAVGSDLGDAEVESSASGTVAGGKSAAVTIEEKGRVYAVDPTGKVTYADNFWGDLPNGQSGFDLLVLKHRNGKEVFKDIAEWMRERASIEDRYAKDLSRLAKFPLADFEQGTMKTAWHQIKFDVENQSRAHGRLATSLTEQVERQLMAYKDEAKKKRKDFEQIIAKDRKLMASRESEVDKARRRYVDAMKTADASELTAQRAMNDVNKALYVKLDGTAKTDRKRATQTGIDYKKAVDDYNEARRQWEDDMSLASLDFQEAEFDRLEYLKKTLQTYIESDKEVREQLNQSGEMVLSSVQAVNADIDIELFVRSKATGTQKPPGISFKAYNPNPKAQQQH